MTGRKAQLTSGSVSGTLRSSPLEYIIRHSKEYLSIKGINDLLKKTKREKKKKEGKLVIGALNRRS